MTDSKTPDWADVAARALDVMPPEGPQLRSHRIASISQALLSAYERGRKEGIEEAAKVVGPTGPRPCNCDRCDCMNAGDLEAVTSWDIQSGFEAAIRQLLEVKG
jgi:hypothetical protein